MKSVGNKIPDAIFKYNAMLFTKFKIYIHKKNIILVFV